MEEISKLRLKIHEIGQQMVNCSNECEGITCSLEKGILPRCLMLETDGRPSNRGTAIVGINPGKARLPERDYYKNGQNYGKVVEYWNINIRKLRYYSSLRQFVDQLGFDGPILWTELVKCESAMRGRIPPLQTFRICTEAYLNTELDSIPDHWPLIAVGGEAYKALAYRFPTRIVIGVPHPTGAYGLFPKLFDANHKLYPTFKLSLKKLWDGKKGQATWFDAKNEQTR